MKDLYPSERRKVKASEFSDSFEIKPLDFHTQEERDHIAAENERQRVAELEQVRQSRRLLLAAKEADQRLAQETLIKRQMRWLTAWHIGLLIVGCIALVKIIESVIANG